MSNVKVKDLTPLPLTASPKLLNVIRFYGNSQYALETIGFKEIIFLHSDKLNDPFDPPFYFVTDFNDDYKELAEYVRQNHQDEFDLFTRCLPEDSWITFTKQIEDYFFQNRNNAFIFSTCEINDNNHPKDSLYMWGHYGNGHRGVAIEFDTSLLTQALLKNMETKETEILTEIKYLDELPKVTCESIYQFIIKATKGNDGISEDETELFKIFQLTFHSKSTEWKKEKERRFIVRNDKTKLKLLRISLEDNTVKAIYLGCRIDDQVEKDLIFEIKNKFPYAKIYKSKMKQGNFALEFEQLL